MWHFYGRSKVICAHPVCITDVCCWLNLSHEASLGLTQSQIWGVRSGRGLNSESDVHVYIKMNFEEWLSCAQLLQGALLAAVIALPAFSLCYLALWTPHCVGPWNIESNKIPMYLCSVAYRKTGGRTHNKKRSSGHPHISIRGPNT